MESERFQAGSGAKIPITRAVNAGEKDRSINLYILLAAGLVVIIGVGYYLFRRNKTLRQS